MNVKNSMNWKVARPSMIMRETTLCLQQCFLLAWVTLGRAQLNFGEPDNAIESFDRALALKPDYEEAQDDRKTASRLVKKRKQLHSSGLSATQNRYMVGEKDENQ